MNMHTARGLLATMLLCAAGSLGAQNYPAGPVRFLVPFPAGGGIDTMGRILGQKMSEAIGKPVIVENRAGANGLIGSRFVARDTRTVHALVTASISSPRREVKNPDSSTDGFVRSAARAAPIFLWYLFAAVKNCVIHCTGQAKHGECVAGSDSGSTTHIVANVQNADNTKMGSALRGTERHHAILSGESEPCHAGADALPRIQADGYARWA